YASYVCLCLTHFHTYPPSLHIHALSLHDALPISPCLHREGFSFGRSGCRGREPASPGYPTARCAGTEGRVALRRRWRWMDSTRTDRKSTRLNSSHVKISYAVFCLKKKKNRNKLII